jgi:hypothetical protein
MICDLGEMTISRRRRVPFSDSSGLLIVQRIGRIHSSRKPLQINWTGSPFRQKHDSEARSATHRRASSGRVPFPMFEHTKQSVLGQPREQFGAGGGLSFKLICTGMSRNVLNFQSTFLRRFGCALSGLPVLDWCDWLHDPFSSNHVIPSASMRIQRTSYLDHFLPQPKFQLLD